MIDAKFWKVLAENWAKSDDGIKIPIVDPGNAMELNDDDLINDQEIADILADLGLDDL